MKHTAGTIWSLAGCLFLMGGSVDAADTNSGAGTDMTNAGKARETRVEGKAENQARIERRAEEIKAGEPNPGGPISTDNSAAMDREAVIERDNPEKNARSMGENVTLTGHVVDLSSYLSDGTVTSFDPDKIKAGEAPLIGLLTGDNKVHLVLNCDQHSEFIKALKDQSGQAMTVKGMRMERGGLCAIKVKSTAPATEAESADLRDRRADMTTNPGSGADPNAQNNGSDIDKNKRDMGPASTNNPAIENR